MPSFSRTLVIASALFVFTNGILFFVARRVFDRPGTWEDSVIRPALVIAALAATALVVLDRYRSSGRRLAAPNALAAGAIAAYSLIALFSTIWSDDPGRTSWRAVVYIALGLLAWVVADLGPGVRRPLAWVAAAAIVGSLAVLVVRSDIGLDRNDDWRGFYTGRNSLAPLAALAVIVGVRYLMEHGRERLFGGALCSAGVVVLFGSGSRTAWLALIVALGIATMPVIHQRVLALWGRSRARIGTAAITLAGAVVFVAAMGQLWGASTFEQRRTIWDVLWDRIQERPIHGHGFFIFWEIPENLQAHFLLERGSAHNSLVEVWLGLGLLGLVPFLVIVGLAAWNAGTDLVRAPSADTWMWAAVVGFLLLENVTESFVLWFSYNWVIVMAAALRRPLPRPMVVAAPESSAATLVEQSAG